WLAAVAAFQLVSVIANLTLPNLNAHPRDGRPRAVALAGSAAALLLVGVVWAVTAPRRARR
ncbi:hypothetical protein, partial [Tsukamurella soli]|uniref:hypothetical protein n=1 Tax=Tsukamurella soli TaxID=644556 RepID=UPI0031E9C860